MGPDRAKQFMKKNAGRIPAGEQVQGVIIAEAKGGAWRRGVAGAGSATAMPAHDAREKERTGEMAASAGGEAAKWPAASIFWLVLTDKQLHVFEGRVNSQEVGASASYPRDRIARMDYQKKLLISKLDIGFADGSSVELDVAKQKMGPFVEALGARA
ncbi:MAG TPA: hypothetical protein VHN37_03855 [Actinomycetota bacterium]|nr:hypothetical protein [Actinomycetota bacterium]